MEVQALSSIGVDNIIGNKTLCERLYSDIRSGTLGHAYIIEGKSGSGRHTLAKTIIAALACESEGDKLPCYECKNCRDILEDKCPDVFLIGKEDKKTSVGIGSIRAIKSTIMAVANNLDFKAYIIEDADTMTQQAQNAFLLTLEQPPSRVYFFILAENARSLLETIRSRAPVIRTEALSDGEIDAFISSSRVDKSISDAARSLKASKPDEYATVMLSANGSIGRAIELLSPKTRGPIIASRELAMNFISALLKRAEFTPPIVLLPLFSAKRDGAAEQLEYVKNALRDLILLKKTDNAPLCFFSDRDEALDLSSMLAERRLISAFDNVDRAQSLLYANANLKLTLTDLLARI